MATAEDEENSASREIIDMQLGKCKYVRVGDNITYIGVGVVLRDSEGVLEILMVQEAKRRCYGKWYIPSGRIERGETIVEGVSREVLEETGYKCDPEELLCLQVQGSGWYRFAFYCSVIGGERKTVADAESLASDWFPVEDVRAKKIETRGTDFLKILDDALRYRSWRTHHPQTLRQFLPISANVRGLFIEFLIMRHANTKTELLVRHDITDCEQILHSSNVFPLAEFGFEYFFAMVVSKCFQQTGPAELQNCPRWLVSRSYSMMRYGDWPQAVCERRPKPSMRAWHATAIARCLHFVHAASACGALTAAHLPTGIHPLEATFSN
ncbi:Putative nudix hydrolase 1 [Toxocara canis]|uniref:Putative nudix hydrolase 1 n=1 Tax=Toxocara canis TaxID=6265 RepID=A0A0B2VFM4_TOXCA|nr:Putative nudix hydrolase 1 [Toxocara canis]